MTTPESGREPSEMVRRVARAICCSFNDRLGKCANPCATWQHHLPDALAAIQAMRKPTPAALARITDADLEAKMDGRHLGFKGKLSVYIDDALGTSQTAEHCTMCGRLLDVPGDAASENCGGDCCACMADAGDPDCIAALGAGQTEGEG